MQGDWGFAEAMSRLRGQPCSGLKRTYGSMFFLELGQLLQRKGGINSHGEQYFLLECCYWRFEDHNRVVVGSDDCQDFIDLTFKQLILGSIEVAEITVPSHDLLIKFRSGVTFRTFTNSAKATDEWTQWILYGSPEEGCAWVFDGGGNLKFIREDEPIP